MASELILTCIIFLGSECLGLVHFAQKNEAVCTGDKNTKKQFLSATNKNAGKSKTCS